MTEPTLTRPNLRAAREALEMSQLELAFDIGVSPATLSRIESGMRPSTEIATKLVRRFPDLATLEEWRQ